MKTSTKLLIAILVLFGLGIVALTTTGVIMLLDTTDEYGANVAVIPIEGMLLATGDNSPFSSDVATSDTLVDDIKAAGEDDLIKAVVLLINSPGGSAVASDEIAQAVSNLDKPSVAVIREVGASGAYWIASAADHVVANRMSVTGSIGVIGSYLSFGDFLKDWNVTYNRLVSGDKKDVGTPWRELTPDEQAYLQQKMDLIHDEFIKAVAANRNMQYADVKQLADGGWLLGSEALDVGLVDELGGLDTGLDWINSTLHIAPVVKYVKHEPSLIDILTGKIQVNPLGNLDAGVSVPMAK